MAYKNDNLHIFCGAYCVYAVYFRTADSGGYTIKILKKKLIKLRQNINKGMKHPLHGTASNTFAVYIDDKTPT